MGRLFWIIMAILGLGLLVLLTMEDSGTVLGMNSNIFASALYSTLLAGLIGSAILARGTRFVDTIKQLAIWTLIIVALMAGYIFRYDLQDLGSRFTGGLIPGSPISRQTANGSEVTLIRSENGHFEAVASVNERPVRFLIDTGASSILLSHDDAISSGIDTKDLHFTIVTSTANGTTRVAETRVRSIDIGSIKRRNVRVFVSQPGNLDVSLLGQSFLESLSSYEKRGDRLTLRD